MPNISIPKRDEKYEYTQSNFLQQVKQVKESYNYQKTLFDTVPCQTL